MLTRARSLSAGMSRPFNDHGESPRSIVRDITVVSHPVHYSSPVGKPCVSAGMSDSCGTSVSPKANLVTSKPQAVGSHSVGKMEGEPTVSVVDIEADQRSESSIVSRREADLANQILQLKIEKLTLELTLEREKGKNAGRDVNKLPSGVSLPKIEILSYDGSPSEYWSFKRSFEVNIESLGLTEAQKFNYLRYYCKGKALEVIKGCSVLDQEVSYSEAWRLLEKQFGRPHRVVRALLDGILEGGPIKEDLESLQTLCRKMKECLISLTQMGRVRDLDWEKNLLALVNRLPIRIREKWATKSGRILDEGREPVFADLLELVEKRISAMDNVYGMALNKPSPLYQGSYQRQPSRVSVVRSSAFPACSWCHGDAHGLGGCKEFARASPQARREFVWKNKRCFLCLGVGHLAHGCKSTARCSVDKCQSRHHVLLHTATPTDSEASRVNSAVTARKIRLGFIPVVIKGPNSEVATNALIDNGSDVSLISKHLAERLQLTGVGCTLQVRTLHGTKPLPSERVCFNVSSVDHEFLVESVKAFTTDVLPCPRVDRPVDLSRWSHLRDLTVETLPDDEVGMLIGCDMPQAHWVMDQRIGKSNEPHAVLTPFGWAIRGNVGGPTQVDSRVNSISTELMTPEESLEAMYRREFEWSNDNESEAPSREDAKALSILEKSTIVVNGRYEVGVPWKRDDPRLPNNYLLAHRRVTFLRKRLLRDEDLLARYQSAVNAYIAKEYVSVVDSDCRGKRWFLPHHPVINPKKPDKVRIVFDCAARFLNRSLNDELLSGPNLNNDLAGVLTRFREGPFATAADIEEMFLRVRLPERDRWAFSFLWWMNDKLLGEPRIFQWNVHPFGAASSPFCAAYALRMASNATTILEPCRLVVRDNFYVDDCLVAYPSIDVASRLSEQLKDMLGRVGFRLTKWVSNSPETLRRIPMDDRMPVSDSRDLVDKVSHSTLGLRWDTKRDTIGVNLRVQAKSSTKRGVLSTVASFFDPLGIVGPLLLPARMFLQRLCRQGLGWDSKLSASDCEWWENWLDKMSSTPTIEIPRFPGSSVQTSVAYELHVFSDASETGFGAVAYLRSTYGDGNVLCNFMMGKSRVVPSKPVTIPRLELTAAVLAIKLLKFLRAESRFPYVEAFIWTDSEIVLHYLRNTTRRFKTFVANRVGYVLENSKVEQWRHVPSAINPADLASRGITKASPTEIELWLKGPAFLRLSPQEWPPTQLIDKDLGLDDEVRRVAAATVTIGSPSMLSKLLLRYSTWTGLVRGVAWLKRFARYVVIMRGDTSTRVNVGNLRFPELAQAEKNIIELIQQERFSRDMELVGVGKGEKVKADLARLKPVIQDGLLCLGGRVSHKLILLPDRHKAVDLMIEHYHKVGGHMGTTYVLAAIRRKYWIVRGMANVRRNLLRCMVCRAATAKPCGQTLAPAPSWRTLKGLCPFMECGVDYFGPLEVKVGRSTVKRYGCLFTCMKTRAVHIEIAHALSTDSFLMALLRFIGRRGVPENIYSDNGSNFVGAESELKRMIDRLDQSRIAEMSSRNGFEWHFNPPYASHRGGIWERMIRTTRRVLASVAGHQRLTDESLSTYMVETERLINDRPIAPVYDDPDHPTALRPNDLLLLRPNSGIPTADVNLLERYTKDWRQAQYLASVFWKRWIREYLPTLQVASKWIRERRDLKRGDLVLILGGSSTCGRWPKGVIDEVVEGLDGHVRTVRIRTADGMMDRDIRSVSLLEADIEASREEAPS